ncbi:MAG: diaminopimelate epimerase [Deferribacteres bacterium]|nr:diaminopimelate epimerase [candidate division KSB1 bacterium]MCB9501266.1 diaminopimelate epimerase [Deferribacteres bacterium]
MPEFHFTKLSATGNDFILIDNREKQFQGDEYTLFKNMCTRRTGIGADGILLIENSEKADFKMRYYNADGYEAEMCGNGARASAYYANTNFIFKAAIKFEVSGEIYTATVDGTYVALLMQTPTGVKIFPKIVETNEFTEGAFLFIGVPHYVLFVDDVDLVDVEKIGSYYCEHPAFNPHKTNVNFVARNKNEFKIRTYERGVYNETLSCGTGTVASAFTITQTQGKNLPLTFNSRGGKLTVDIDRETNRPVLKGTVSEVYKGTFQLNQ